MRRYGAGGERADLAPGDLRLRVHERARLRDRGVGSDVSRHVAAPLPFEVVADLVTRLSDVVHRHSAALTTLGCARVRNLWAWEDPALGLDVLQVHTYPDTRHPAARRRSVRPAAVGARRVARGAARGVSRRRAAAVAARCVAAADDARAVPGVRARAGATPARGRGASAAPTRYGRMPHEPLLAFARRHPELVEPALPCVSRSPREHAAAARAGLAGGPRRQPHGRRRHGRRSSCCAVRSCAAAGSTSGSTACSIAVSRFTPGTNVLAYCAALGWTHHRRRRRGAWPSPPGRVPGAAIVTVLTAAAASSIAGRPCAPCWPWPRSWPPASCSRAPGRSCRPHLRGVAPGLDAWRRSPSPRRSFLAGATPVRVLLVLAIWGALTAGTRRRRREPRAALRCCCSRPR